MYKYNVSLLLIFLLFHSSIAIAQESVRIVEIKEQFSIWQSIIKKELSGATKIYQYAWGKNYEKTEWQKKEDKSDEKTLSEEISIIRKKKLGYFIQSEKYSFSGDWFVVSEHYYDDSGSILFIFWKMNTFYGGVTVEKRLYFDPKGKIIRNLKSLYKMNTKEKSNESFMDRDVSYKVDINKLPYRKYLTELP